MTQYAKKYSADDLYDMFANQADVNQLAAMPANKIRLQLLELAPDMEDAGTVAVIIKRMAQDKSY